MRLLRKTFVSAFISLLFITATPGYTLEEKNTNAVIPIPTQAQQPVFTPSSPHIDAKGYILMDAHTGKILAEQNSDVRMPPASLTKLMSLYLISSAAQNGSIHWNDPVRVSTKAWKMEGSRMFIKVGSEVPARDL